MFSNAWLRFRLYIQSLGIAGSTFNQRTRCRAAVGLQPNALIDSKLCVIGGITPEKR